MSERDLFDLDSLAMPVEAEARIKAAAELESKSARRKQSETGFIKRRGIRFARMPLDWSSRMGRVLHSAEQMVVLMHLVYHATFANGAPFAATATKTGNARPDTKLQTLRLLEAAGVAEIEWRGRGRSPIILKLKV